MGCIPKLVVPLPESEVQVPEGETGTDVALVLRGGEEAPVQDVAEPQVQDAEVQEGTEEVLPQKETGVATAGAETLRTPT